MKILKFTAKNIYKRTVLVFKIYFGCLKYNRELNKEGFELFKKNLSETKCKKLVDLIDLIISNGEYSWKDNEDSDYRIYEGENFYKEDLKLPELDKFNSMAMCFHGKNFVFTDLISRISYKEGNKGSGGGWHRDSSYPQFKTLTYLNDVDEKGGPFQIVPFTHSWKNIKNLLFQFRNGYYNKRFADIIVQNSFKEEAICSDAGTTIIVNTYSLHRGMPLKEGVRYAITRYYFDNKDDKLSFLDKLIKT